MTNSFPGTIPPPDAAAPRGPGLGARVRTWFLTGVVVAGPLAVTGYLVWWFVNTVDSMVSTIVPERVLPDAYLPIHIPGFGVVIAMGLLVGAITFNHARRLTEYRRRLLVDHA